MRGYLRKKAFFLRFLDFPGAHQALRKRAKKAEKGRKRPISQKESSKRNLAKSDENQKGTAGRGREKKCHDNLRQTSRHFTTTGDILSQFPSLCSITT